jgi:flavin reductase (DIM6/NTAB) family NADH-FMN oxidoreductase RutF
MASLETAQQHGDIHTVIQPDAFREVMGGVAAPVSVITSALDGVPHGTTVSAFTSLSLEPPMILVCLDLKSDLLSMIHQSQRFGVNVLDSGGSGVAMAFARKGGDKFASVNWLYSDGLPRLDDAAGWLACSVDNMITAGDHVIITGLATEAASHQGEPLTYYRRSFGTHARIDGGQS